MDVPAGSVFKGYKKYIRQDIEIKAVNTCYEVESWQAPDGRYLYGQLPLYLQGTDFGPTLKSYIIYQYHHCHVTQPLLLEQLREWDICISSGQLSRLLTEGHEGFHQEKEDLLDEGKNSSGYLQTDDTGARHAGGNGYCTFIGNEWFSYFKSTGSKSRINFLEILNGGESYCINGFALQYASKQGIAPKYFPLLKTLEGMTFASEEVFLKALGELGIREAYAVRTITQASLLGNLIDQGLSQQMVILSDDAGQFNIPDHALCWVHVERNLQKINTYTAAQGQELEHVLEHFWILYQQMKLYAEHPNEKAKAKIEKEFNDLCDWHTQWIALQKALDKLKTYKTELLLSLQYPGVPLHNNASERDIREYVKKRKISGSTRSENGRKARDTFTALKKTCRKMKISFWEYLKDRITLTNNISQLPQLLHDKAAIN